jgi:hypothetical protein
MPAIPNRLFDVRNGNGSTDADGTLYPAAFEIICKDAAAKNKVIDALCEVGNYAGLKPEEAPSKRVFAENQIQAWLKGIVTQARQIESNRAAASVDTTDLP